MVYPKVSIDEWLELHKPLRDPDLLCNCSKPRRKPFIFRKNDFDRYGIECGNCGTTIWYTEEPELFEDISDLAEKLTD